MFTCRRLNYTAGRRFAIFGGNHASNFEHLKPCIDWWEKREGNEVAWKVTIDEIKARNFNLDFKNPHTVEEDHGDPAELLAKLEESEAATATLRDRLKAILEEALLR